MATHPHPHARHPGRRDLGSALVRGGAGSARASTWLRSPLGLATAIHRPTFLGWLAGTMILAGLMGELAQQFIDAVLGNPAMAEALGVSSGRPVDAMVALTQLYIAIIATGYAVQAIGSLRGDETAGRLEVRLSGYLIAVWAIATGVAEAVAAYQFRQALENDRVLAISGVISYRLAWARQRPSGSR